MKSTRILQQNAKKCKKNRILDLINTDKSAKELLEHRVAQVNKSGIYENAIYCSSGEYVERLRAKGHTVYAVDTPRGMSAFAVMKSIWKTYRVLRKHKFDIIHTHGSVVGVIGRTAAFMARTPIVIHQVHGFHHHENMSPVKKWGLVKTEKLFALITDKLLFQNDADLKDCINRQIAPVIKLVLIGNGIQLDSFLSDIEPDNHPKVILCVGRFEPVKNHYMLLKAVRILKERGVSFMLQLAGDGDLGPEYKKWARQSGLENYVTFLGYRDDVPSLTAKADICVLPSIKEGLPRTIIEAAAAGRPMVATDVVGNRDTLIDGQTGFLVSLNDTVALADRLEQLLSDSKLRRKLGQQAQQYAREHFDERNVTERIITVYDQLVPGLNELQGK